MWAQAAFDAFDSRLVDGKPPPSPPPFHLASQDPARLALDSHGNVIGGVRTPAVDVPASTLSGAAPAGASVLCSLFGSSIPFTERTLTDLYHNKQTYLAEYRASLNKSISDGSS